MRAHRRSLLAVDYFTVETIWLQRLYVMFFIELGSRRVHLAGCTANPSGAWVTQQARQLTWTIADGPESFRFVIRDRDQKFADSFDDVFRSVGMEIIRTPFRAPQANGVAERFVRPVRSECLDRLLILDQRHLERTVAAFIDHLQWASAAQGAGPQPAATATTAAVVCLSDPWNVRSASGSSRWRDSRVLQCGLTDFPHPTRPSIAPAAACGATPVQRRDRLGGVVHEYARAA